MTKAPTLLQWLKHHKDTVFWLYPKHCIGNDALAIRIAEMVKIDDDYLIGHYLVSPETGLSIDTIYYEYRLSQVDLEIHQSIQEEYEEIKKYFKGLRGKKVIEEQSDIDDDEGTYGSAQV
jgi:hypothetical protein